MSESIPVVESSLAHDEPMSAHELNYNIRLKRLAKTVLGCLIASGAMAASPALAQEFPPTSTIQNSGNWTGFGISPLPTSTIKVEEAFIVPTLTCNDLDPDATTSFWVGLGSGMRSNDSPIYEPGTTSSDPLYQGGVYTECFGNVSEGIPLKPYYIPFWEEYPENLTQGFVTSPLKRSIESGDKVIMSVDRNLKNQTAQIKVADYEPTIIGTDGSDWKLVHTYKSPKLPLFNTPSEAECISETPTDITTSDETDTNVYFDPSNFGSVLFTQISKKITPEGCDIAQQDHKRAVVTSISEAVVDPSFEFPEPESLITYLLTPNNNQQDISLIVPSTSVSGQYTVSYSQPVAPGSSS